MGLLGRLQRKIIPVPFWLAGVFLLSFALPVTASALTSISQSYTTTDKVSVGSIVSLQKSSTDHVIASGSDTVDGVIGVVINADSALLSLSSGGANQVQVATSGIVQVLVSDVNGPINAGDHITASPLAGIGMRASNNVRIVGVAQSSLSGGSKQTYKDQFGKEQTVTVSEIPIVVNVSYYYKDESKSLIPIALQNVANALAGRSVSTLPIVISAAIFVIMLVVVVGIIYTMVRSSIISVGRNPMSQSAVYRDLIQLSGLVILILAAGVVAIFMVLKKL